MLKIEMFSEMKIRDQSRIRKIFIVNFCFIIIFEFEILELFLPHDQMTVS